MMNMGSMVMQNARPLLIKVFEGNRDNPRRDWEKDQFDIIEVEGTVLNFSWNEVRSSEGGEWTQEDIKIFLWGNDARKINMEDRTKDYVLFYKKKYYRIRSTRGLSEYSDMECFQAKKVNEIEQYKPDTRPAPERTEPTYRL